VVTSLTHKSEQAANPPKSGHEERIQYRDSAGYAHTKPNFKDEQEEEDWCMDNEGTYPC